MKLTINEQIYNVDVEPNMPLLWAIREFVGLTGTKYGKKITTIEALSKDSSHPVQKAWIALDVPQCGYCQSGQIMAAAALLKKNPRPTDQDIDKAMSNVCRCGTYQKIRDGIHIASGQKKLVDVLALYEASPQSRG
jgi:isoquinoline 1-oxidoreductase subunit alpha